MSEHECIIGMYYDFDDTQLITLVELQEKIKWCISMDEYCKSNGWPTPRAVYTLSDYCNRRKSTNLTKFEFCPYCGKKIDWKKIKSEETEV